MSATLDYNDETRNFDELIGCCIAGHNGENLGEIVKIDVCTDGWGHQNAWAVLDNGRRINCRTLAL